MAEDVYGRLAAHVATLGMGPPEGEGLEELLRATFTPLEAEVALALPTRVPPMKAAAIDEIGPRVNLPRPELAGVLEKMTERGLVFAGKTPAGERGYALLQMGHGFPQVFFWSGKETPEARNMTQLVLKYMHRGMLARAYGASQTKAFRYIPVGESIDTATQAVYPYDMMEKVIERVRVVAVAHCPCRMMMQIRGRGCTHPQEVCLKYDELAEYVIERGLGRQVSRDEALRIIKKSEEIGLVHFVDNADGGIKHT